MSKKEWRKKVSENGVQSFKKTNIKKTCSHPMNETVRRYLMRQHLKIL